ncbi:hypothetical protein Tco_0969940 [Tanacetum coccineum]
MLGKKPSPFYDPYMRTGLGYQNLERPKKSIAAQPKIYNGNNLKNNKLKIDLPNYEETLEDAKKSRLKMKNKMIPLDYSKLNTLYESYVPQMEISAEQTYFSSPSTSNESSKSSSKKSDLPANKIPNESQLLKLFVNLDKEVKELGKLINIHHKMDKDTSFIYENKGDIRRIFTLEIVLISGTLNECSKEIKPEITSETYAYGDVLAKNPDLLMTISELTNKLKTAEKGKNVNTKFDKFATLGKLLCVTSLNKNKDLKANMVSKVEVKTDKSKPVTLCSTPKNEQGQKKNVVASFSSVRRLKSKDTDLKKIVLLNTKSKSTSKDVKKSQTKGKGCLVLMAKEAGGLKEDLREKLEVEVEMVRAGGGDVKGGGVVFGVSRILLGEILEDIMGESGGEAFGVDGEAD